MNDWRDFPDEPGFWWRLTLRYSSAGDHGVSTLEIKHILEIAGDLALTGDHDGSITSVRVVVGRRPDPQWREKQEADAKHPWACQGRHFHPYRWLKITEPDLGRDKHGRISREIVWESK